MPLELVLTKTKRFLIYFLVILLAAGVAFWFMKDLTVFETNEKMKNIKISSAKMHSQSHEKFGQVLSSTGEQNSSLGRNLKKVHVFLQVRIVDIH